MENHEHSESCSHGVVEAVVTSDDVTVEDIQNLSELLDKASVKKEAKRKARNKRKGAVRLAKVNAKNKEEVRLAKKGMPFGAVIVLREAHNKPSHEQNRRIERDARRKRADEMRKINKLKVSSTSSEKKLKDQSEQVIILDDGIVVE